MGEVWTVAFRASSFSNPSQILAALCGLFSSQAAEEGIVCWHNTSDPSRRWEIFWGGVEAVPHFHRDELVWRGGDEWRWEISIPCVHFHLQCSVQFPQEWPMSYLKPSLYRAWQRQLCRDGSTFLTLQSSLFCYLVLEENLSCHSCLASLPWPFWAIKSLVYTPTPWWVCAVHTHKPTHRACNLELDSLINKCLVDELSVDIGTLPYAWN